MAQLKELVDIYLGVTHTPEYVEKGVPFLSVKDISSGKICFDDCKYISEDEYNGLSQGAKPQVGDMLFCRVGTIGKPIIIPEGTPIFGSFVSLGYLRNKDANKCSLEYLRYWMYSKSFERQVYANVKGASQVNLNTGWLSKFEVVLPDIVTQEDIVKKLDRCIAVIDKRKQELEELDNLIKSRFVEMFGDPHVGFNYPKRKFKEYASDMTKGPFGSDMKKELYVPKGIDTYKVYIQMNAIQGNQDLGDYYISKEYFDKKISRFEVHPGDYIITCDGTLGKHLKLDDNMEKGVISSSLLRLTLDEGRMTKEYFEFIWDLYMLVLMKKEARNACLVHLPSAKVIGEVEIPIPPFELQKEFSMFAQQVNKLKFEVQKSLNETQTLMDSLMQQYFG